LADGFKNLTTINQYIPTNQNNHIQEIYSKWKNNLVKIIE